MMNLNNNNQRTPGNYAGQPVGPNANKTITLYAQDGQTKQTTTDQDGTISQQDYDWLTQHGGALPINMVPQQDKALVGVGTGSNFNNQDQQEQQNQFQQDQQGQQGQQDQQSQFQQVQQGQQDQLQPDQKFQPSKTRPEEQKTQDQPEERQLQEIIRGKAQPEESRELSSKQSQEMRGESQEQEQKSQEQQSKDQSQNHQCKCQNGQCECQNGQCNCQNTQCQCQNQQCQTQNRQSQDSQFQQQQPQQTQQSQQQPQQQSQQQSQQQRTPGNYAGQPVGPNANKTITLYAQDGQTRQTTTDQDGTISQQDYDWLTQHGGALPINRVPQQDKALVGTGTGSNFNDTNNNFNSQTLPQRTAGNYAGQPIGPNADKNITLHAQDGQTRQTQTNSDGAISQEDYNWLRQHGGALPINMVPQQDKALVGIGTGSNMN